MMGQSIQNITPAACAQEAARRGFTFFGMQDSSKECWLPRAGDTIETAIGHSKQRVNGPCPPGGAAWQNHMYSMDEGVRQQLVNVNQAAGITDHGCWRDSNACCSSDWRIMKDSNTMGTTGG